MSGFNNVGDGDFDRLFFTNTELFENFVGTTLWSWGYNSNGALGDGTTVNKSSPVTTAGGGTNWKQVSGGYFLASAIKTDGTLWTWGLNSSGQLGNNSTVNRSSPNTTVAGGTNWKQVGCGWFHTSAVKTDGTLWAWGQDSYGKLGDGTTVNKSSPVTTAGGGTNWKQVAGGMYHTAAVKTDGTLWTWGGNWIPVSSYGGMLGDNTTVNKSSPVTTAGGGTNWKQVACGDSHTGAVKTDGTLWTWGYNNLGQLGDNTTVNKSSPVTVAGGGTNWKQVSCAFNHTAAIKTDGTLWTWGFNINGQLGDNTTVNKSSPVTVAGGGTNWKQVSVCPANQTTAIKTDGTLWTWGLNNNGQLGDNTTVNKSSPINPTMGSISMWKTVGSGYTPYALSQN